MNAPAPAKSNTAKIVAAVIGIGCLGLLATCCVGIGGSYLYASSTIESAARAHAERFLAAVQARDFPLAFGTTESFGGSDLYSVDQLQTCLLSTSLADMTSYTCGDVEWSITESSHADVECTITSASSGAVDVTIGVNSPDSMPYLGFVWFAANGRMGPEWHGDSCARWSGREYFQDPPAGRVRP